jgi:hypothetical protein
MTKLAQFHVAAAFSLIGGLLVWASGPAAADTLKGKVLGGGQPITNSTVSLWATSAGAPQQLGQARTGSDGSFTLNSTGGTGAATPYLNFAPSAWVLPLPALDAAPPPTSAASEHWYNERRSSNHRISPRRKFARAAALRNGCFNRRHHHQQLRDGEPTNRS